MICPRCGKTTSRDASRCTACGASFFQTSVVTGVIPIDTTGLPPGATFGASQDGSTMGSDPTGATGTGGGQRLSGEDAGPLRVGQAFSTRYHIIKLLGIGGMGAVYQAWDAELGVAVALKVIRTDARRRAGASEAEKRFKQELLLARQVTH